MVQETQNTPQHHVAILASPGMGHLIPILEFAKRLIHHLKISVTCIIPTNGPPSSAMKEVLQTVPQTLTHIFVPVMDLPKDATPAKLISKVMTMSLSPLRDVLKSLIAKTKLLALIVDILSTEGFDIADELNLPSYIFFPSNAMCLSLMFYLPKLHEMVHGSIEFRDLIEPVRIPGCVPVHGRDLVETVSERKGDTFEWFIYHCKRYGMAKGIVVNSFIEIEPGPIKALKDEEENGCIPPVYPIGPVIRMDTGSIDSTKVQNGGGNHGTTCLKWLDEQPKGSVLFISFGSGGTLSYNQLQELAMGLELSGQRFLWVMKEVALMAWKKDGASTKALKEFAKRLKNEN
ncbi:hypothetical protein ACFE04_026489 [Oxalis oulophora]